MKRRTLLFSAAAAIAPVPALNAGSEARLEKTILVGATRVRVVVDEVKSKFKRGLIYFHPHENEHASALASRHVIQQLGGKLVEIRSEGERLITFKLKGQTFSFDPNRMFTDVGLAHSLTHFGPTSEPALRCAISLRDSVLAEFDGGKTPIIAAHNNVEDGVNALSFRSGGPLSEQAVKIAVNPTESPRNFFLVLDDQLFTRLHHAGFNTVLQSPNAPDDGSLSVFCHQHKWRYVNVEASDNSMQEQERMLMVLPSALG